MIPLALYALAALAAALGIGVIVALVAVYDWAAKRWGWDA